MCLHADCSAIRTRMRRWSVAFSLTGSDNACNATQACMSSWSFDFLLIGVSVQTTCSVSHEKASVQGTSYRNLHTKRRCAMKSWIRVVLALATLTPLSIKHPSWLFDPIQTVICQIFALNSSKSLLAWTRDKRRSENETQRQFHRGERSIVHAGYGCIVPFALILRIN